MSHSRVLAFELAKEGFHQRGQLLDSAQSADGRPFHFAFGLHEAFGDAALHVRPNLFVGVQVRPVRRQIEQLQASLLRFHEIQD